MLLRAWGRATALLFRRSPALILPNLQASLIVALLGLAWTALVAMQAPSGAYVLLKIFSMLAAWMTFSWLAFTARRAFEEAHFKPGLAELRAWLALRGRERLLSFLVALLAFAWLGLALAFYRAAAMRFWIASAAAACIAMTACAFAGTLAINFALASRPLPDFRAEWKASLFMVLAFAPQCLGALFSLTVLSGAGVFLTGTESWWGRLVWAPALALPLFSAAFGASFLVALSDEFLARSRGAEPPAFEPFKIRELMQPWR